MAMWLSMGKTRTILRRSESRVSAALLGVSVGLALTQVSNPIAAAPVRYNRDIRPILADNCFACHGPDSAQRKASLRLDDRAAALRPAKSGRTAIVPGRPTESELLQRVQARDMDEVMPPPEVQKRLTVAQKELLRRWIAEGANYEAHWAFVPPQ